MTIINLGNIKINYVEKGNGRPFILIHGIFYDSRVYKGLINILSNFYKVYMIDFPMHGKSEKPKEYLSILNFSEILGKFITKFKIRNPIICAHSAGSLVALEYASKNKIKELVLIEPAGMVHHNSKPWFLFKIIIIKTFLDFFWNPLKTLNVIKVGSYNLIIILFNKHYWSLFNETFSKNYSSKMKKITCPTKILWSKYDEIFPYKLSKKYQKNIKNSEIITVKGNHDWPVIRPKEIIKYIKSDPR